MAGDKTEAPTPKRLEDARQKGQVAKSQDLNSAIVLSGATGAMMFLGGSVFEQLHSRFTTDYQHLLVQLSDPMTVNGIGSLIQDLMTSIGFILLPFFGIGFITALAGNLTQNKPNVSMQAIVPKFDKLNPVSGFKRIFAMRMVIETIKSLLKMSIIAGCGYLIITSNQHLILALGTTTPLIAITKITSVMGQIAMAACVVFIVLGMADVIYQRYEHEKQLKMSKQEIKDEHKNMEGDPKMKGRIREIGVQMSRKQQLKDLKTADVVITNPTHFAVAIKYDSELAPAPIVVAKGVDHFAFKMREVAKENNVMIQENVPLARALYAMADIGTMVPPELFVAVAEILAVVYAHKNKTHRH